MPQKRRKLISIRKPKIRITPKGVKVTKPSARIGDKAGLNISSKGVSYSVRTKQGTYNTRTGFTRRRSNKRGCALVLLAFVISGIGLSVLIAASLTI